MVVIVRAISVHAGEEPQEVVFGAEEEAIELMDRFLLPVYGIAILSSPYAEQREENLTLDLGLRKIYGTAELVGYDEDEGEFRIRDIPEDKKESAIRLIRKWRA